MNRLSQMASVACLVSASFSSGCSSQDETKQEVPSLDLSELMDHPSISTVERSLLPMVVEAIESVKPENVKYFDYPAGEVGHGRMKYHADALTKYQFWFGHENLRYRIEAISTRGDEQIRVSGAGGEEWIDDEPASQIYTVLDRRYTNRSIDVAKEYEEKEKSRTETLNSLMEGLDQAIHENVATFASTWNWTTETNQGITFYRGERADTIISIRIVESELEFSPPLRTYSARVWHANDDILFRDERQYGKNNAEQRNLEKLARQVETLLL